LKAEAELVDEAEGVEVGEGLIEEVLSHLM